MKNNYTSEPKDKHSFESGGRYSFKSIEEKWRERWEREGVDRVDLKAARKPFYNLAMFPYPSAEGLHVGNMFAFIGSDIQGRFHRLNGYDVFEPMGFDAFGMHSENFAIKKGDHPARMTPRNIAYFREHQLKKIGNMYDWSHEVDSTSPEYYRWTQWIFIQLYKAGLANRVKGLLHWCPSCKTVLASEQVIDGECERCASGVTKKEMVQWFLKITDFARPLLDNLDHLDWSEKTKVAQRNWIGRSEGARVTFGIEGSDKTFDIFTTRPDTLFGATYMVFAPEHPLLDDIVAQEHRTAFEHYRRQTAPMTEVERQVEVRDKTGVFTGAYGINPVNEERVPIWVSDYVLMGYGTGAIMAVPAHDQRDFEFAKTFGLRIRQVVSEDGKAAPLQRSYTGDGLLVNSGSFDGLETLGGGRRIVEGLKEKGLADFQVNYRLRDWCISRQRYWGPPIPMIYCDTCGAVPVPDHELPVLLPEMDDYMPDGSGNSPLKRDADFYHTTCPTCGGPAMRETDVSDNFFCSAWYFYRYPSTEYSDRAFDPSMTEKWLPVDLYVGGNEHAVLHLLYSRFLCMALKKIGIIDFDEPFKRFVANGIIVRDGSKMSKSKGNVINPNDYMDRYGTDAFRGYLVFMGDYLAGGNFQDGGVKAMHGFLKRVWVNIQPREHEADNPLDAETRYWLHRTIKKVTEDIRRFSYNTAISRLMELLNHISRHDVHDRSVSEAFIKLLSPFAPHLCEELWERWGHSRSLFYGSWPDYSDEYAVRESIEFVIQINGKVRAKIDVERGLSEKEMEARWQDNPAVIKWIADKEIVKQIFVPDRLVNLVVR